MRSETLAEAVSGLADELGVYGPSRCDWECEAVARIRDAIRYERILELGEAAMEQTDE